MVIFLSGLFADRYGSSGTPVQLEANYFRLKKMPNFALTQYRVDFEPELDVTQTRKKSIQDNKTLLGERYIFDGASLYLAQKFDLKTIETSYNNKPMKITVRKTGSINSNDPNAFQLFNMIFRESMAGLKLQNIRRDYYDPKEKVIISKLIRFLK